MEDLSWSIEEWGAIFYHILRVIRQTVYESSTEGKTIGKTQMICANKQTKLISSIFENVILFIRLQEVDIHYRDIFYYIYSEIH